MPIVGDIFCEANTADEVKAAYTAVNRTRARVRTFASLIGDAPRAIKEGAVAIVGGGPSLAEHLDELKWRQSQGVQIWATNNTFRYLCTRNIYPDAHILLDSRIENAAFITAAAHDVRYYLHVSCHPTLFEMLHYAQVVTYELDDEGYGNTVGLRAMYLAGLSGYRMLHLYGMDSSYKDGQHHAYDQALNDEERQIEVTLEGQTFHCAAWMLHQAEEFQQIASSFADQDCTITVTGDGLLPTLARAMMRVDRVLTCVWDLQVCPPTYDIGSFLGEAERRRIAMGARYIDLIIQPGPIGGFRHDDLPPNLGAREGMLWRVAIAIARRLPSVRNIDIRKVRGPVTGTDIFPDEYTVAKPTVCYGHAFYAKATTQILEASVAARTWVQKKYDRPYLTITIREATHWPERNSNVAAWETIREWLHSLGYGVVWVPDTESLDATAFSWDYDLRLALYEHALLNLGINNGPTTIMAYCHADWMLFKIVTESIPWTSTAFHEQWETPRGAHPGGRGWLVWEPDDVDIIQREVTRWLKKKEVPYA
jgi:uncharacterized Rossmann fold enzyme